MGSRCQMVLVGVNAARAPAVIVPSVAPDGKSAAVGIAMCQSAVCADLNVWPSMPMYAHCHNQEIVCVGTWYWCDDVWVGYYQRGPGEEPTDWLA